MGSSSGQVTGYKYHTSLILFIGNAIEKVLGINFDNRGWVNPLVDENSNALAVGNVNSPNIYGETEGGVAGQIHARYGSPTQLPVEFYSEYLAKNDIPPLAYQHQSYLAFEDFYVGNSGYMKEMLLWPKRVHVKNDGSEQWYSGKAEVPDYQEVAEEQIPSSNGYGILKRKGVTNNNFSFSKSDLRIEHINHGELCFFQGADTGLYWSSTLPIGENTELMTNKLTAENYLENFSTNGLVKTVVTIAIFGGEFKYAPIDIRGLVEIHEVKTQLSDGGFSVQITAYFDSHYKVGFYAEVEGWKPIDPYSKALSLHLNANYYSPERYQPTHILSSDINPIHKIREILTDRTAMSKPESEINEANFIKAADRIWSEGLGISWAIQEKSCIEAINELCYQIEAGIRINRQTGLYEMVLFREDWFDESEIHILAQNKIKNIDLEVQNGYEVINQLNVNYYDRKNIKDSSFSVADNASICNLKGKVNAETVDFPYFMNQRNAEIVANWKLKQFTSAMWKGSFTTSEKQARKWNRYDIVKINWPKKGILNLPVRIISLKFGGPTSNLVIIGFEEVVSEIGNLDTTIVLDDGIDNTVQASKPCSAKVFELPYFEAVQANGERETNAELADNPEAGFICAIAEKPQSNSLNAALYVNGSTGFEKSATVQYCETAHLQDSIDEITHSFVAKNVDDLTAVRIGSQIFINDEIMVYQSFNAQTKILSVKRGALDTVPHNHPVDSILFFDDDFVAIDSTLYVDGEQVEAKVLTTTPSGILSLNDAVTHTIDLHSRAIRPYPPANVKINGEYWPKDIEGDCVLTWVDRNRLQQTGGEILGYYDNGVTIEHNVNYSIEIQEFDLSEVLISSQTIELNQNNRYVITQESISSNTHNVRVILKNSRDGVDCLYSFDHKFKILSVFTAPYNLKAVCLDD